jgi:hypothetical protein
LKDIILEAGMSPLSKYAALILVPLFLVVVIPGAVIYGHMFLTSRQVDEEEYPFISGKEMLTN